MRKLNVALLIGVVSTPIAGSLLWMDYSRAMWGDDQIWWTPREQAIALSEASDIFQIYLEGEPLEAHLKRLSLTGLGGDGMAYFVTPDLIKVRVNNWERTKASLLESAIYSAFASGVSLACLVLGLIQFFREPSRPRPRVAGERARPDPR